MLHLLVERDFLGQEINEEFWTVSMKHLYHADLSWSSMLASSHLANIHQPLGPGYQVFDTAHHVHHMSINQFFIEKLHFSLVPLFQ
jgi:hypothetical protein